MQLLVGKPTNFMAALTSLLTETLAACGLEELFPIQIGVTVLSVALS